ncbi:MAG: glycosyltransferase family 2 protein [Anaerolineae bacterium]|nr:glycosyltransferase family 2 protein [Anaerolineae bacterium]
MFLSVIVPAYNEEKRLPDSLRRIVGYLGKQEYTSEVIVVDDGSEDGTAQVVEEMMAELPILSLLRTEHRGKGHAVKRGMLAGRGEYLFICDADLSMPIEELYKFLPPALESYDVAIASREVPGARRYDEPPYRHFMGRVFNWIVRLFAVRGFQDTQCGFKCFKKVAAQEVFTYQTMDGWGFDVEILFIAQKRGYKIVEVPIDWYYSANSRIHPIRDSIGMFREVMRIRLNDLKGRYRKRG